MISWFGDFPFGLEIKMTMLKKEKLVRSERRLGFKKDIVSPGDLDSKYRKSLTLGQRERIKPLIKRNNKALGCVSDENCRNQS